MEFPGVVEGDSRAGHGQGDRRVGQRAGGVRGRQRPAGRRHRRPTSTAWSWCRGQAAAEVARLGSERVAKEEKSRERLRNGELGLDFYGLRAKLTELGVRVRCRRPVS